MAQLAADHAWAVGRLRGTAPLLGLFACCALAGCHTPPARVSACEAKGLAPRAALLARQLVEDTAIELCTHPARSGAAFVTETTDAVWTAGWGAVGKRLLLPLLPPCEPPAPDRPTLDPVALEAALRRCTGTDAIPAHLELCADGAEALAALERLIDGARCRIDVLMFMWQDDVVGRALAERLAARARDGVTVRVLVDGGGNLVYRDDDGARSDDPNGAVRWLARQPGVEVIRGRNGFARFDHRKLVVIDGQTAWTGGRNFVRQAFAENRDASLTIAGPPAVRLAAAFEDAWREQGGAEGIRGEEQSAFGDSPDLPDRVRLVGTGPLRRDLADALLCAIEQARSHIYLENPYLCDSRMVLALARARRRGVDVRVVLTLHTQPELSSHANRVTANRMLRAGVRVYLHPGPTHLKALSVDGLWAYVGTGNFDPLSLRHDYELGIAVGAGPAVREIEETLLAPDLRDEWELHCPLTISLSDWLCEMAASWFG